MEAALFFSKVSNFKQIQSPTGMASSLNSSMSCRSNPLRFAFASHHKAPSFSFSECSSFRGKNHRYVLKSSSGRTRATLDEKDHSSIAAVVLDQEQFGPVRFFYSLPFLWFELFLWPMEDRYERVDCCSFLLPHLQYKRCIAFSVCTKNQDSSWIGLLKPKS